ncbi:hypothetical protein SERLA73DRAFT_177038 [Serpula lacrymans var. lacrymans S7.3]|uniref:Nucleoside transporter n=2 Tax=Serpula lacrymans var. lacrymans TaxID=341189 RepID=F8PQR4_SERL3|nr:uncharacterized protein SERLADRAFT_460421 [Serpula lacrymans var. lacrymans S7.9]EGO01624.1 hypothetical protein SERLA73DRAFT_177038 [Serpula lacrymans var. lacrymans S7.3]EGO27279.1 hypothetical protein SERLADRAFT_460421 [Serpula lacrymans var. lacrymans S7.9]
MSHRRPASSISEFEAPYQPVSQLPDNHDQLTVDDTSVGDDVNTLVSSSAMDPRIRWVYFMLGAAGLLPWNAMMNATPFFITRLAGSPLQQSFTSYLSMTFTATQLMSLARATATVKQSSPSWRASRAMSILAVLVSLLVLSTFIHIPPGWFFTFVILNGICQAGSVVYLSSAFYAGASLFGPACLQAVMTGQAAVAVVVSSVQVMSSIASVWGEGPENVNMAEYGAAEERSASIFLSISALFLVATIMAHSWMTTLPAYKAKVGVLEQHKRSPITSDSDSDELQGLVVSPGPIMASTDSNAQVLRVFKANFIYQFTVFYVFVVTLAVFPPITISIGATNPKIHPLLFTAFHFLIFNIGDFAGRYICSFPRLIIWSARRQVTLAALRTLFIPLFLMCNVQGQSSTNVITPIITSDILYMLILCMFGVTNGYVSSISMIAAPSLEHNPRLKGREDVDVAATVANFCLTAGLAVGSVASFAVRAAICDCNPFTK